MKRRLLFLFFICAVVLSAAEEGTGASSEPGEIWKWANLLILVGGLWWLLKESLPSYFRNRSAEIQKGIAEAQQMKRDAEKRSADMEARLKALGADIETFKTQAALEMQQEGERIRQDTVVQIKKLEQQAAAEVEAAGKTARRELREYAATLAFELAEQRIRTSLTDASEAAVIEAFVSDLGRQAAKGTNN